ncbi:Mre11 DNA bind and Metallophos domain containing protein [Trichuris trichiura]|uniref:Mre11 DNA bind and Metallophos domain containing protein n=1 Tax=Trichuris trichiura TaxID=36087 RepID=A0A077ZI89_TRITR|nr:Mre11 DNA bind and Metallophos domain containing protein [Trichuris trichiura]
MQVPDKKVKMSESIKLLIATDIHLGFAETDPVRRDDSTNTFEEILKIATDRKVDALLLGGDLFHDNRPSRAVYHKCVELLRKYCFYDRTVNISLENDASVHFSHSAFKRANFQDPLLHIGLPVFSIHGNHDDIASNGLCALDMLHAAGLLNYFGKYQSVEEITVAPLCIRKGSTCLALYGIGFIRDERLHRMFTSKKVHFVPPEDSCFCILLLHQNRVRHSLTNYIPEQFLPEFMDLVIWGHEHPCLIDPEFHDKFFIMQPGSTIATSLAEGEAGSKYISLVKIRGKAFQAEKIELQTARQFYFVDLSAEEIFPNIGAEVENKLQRACEEKIHALINNAMKDRLSGLRPDLPLVRLRIRCSADYPTFNAKRFGRRFEGRIANPENLISFVKSRAQRSDIQLDRLAMESASAKRAIELQVHIEDVVKDYFKKADSSCQMSLLSENSLREALRNYARKYEIDSFGESIKQQFNRATHLLQERGVHDAHQIYTLLGKLKRSRAKPPQSGQEERSGRGLVSVRNSFLQFCLYQRGNWKMI